MEDAVDMPDFQSSANTQVNISLVDLPVIVGGVKRCELIYRLVGSCNEAE